MSASRGPVWLFVPGDRPERFPKAAAAGADQVIHDLEDAVAPTGKPTARHHVAEWLSGAGSGWVRVNAPGTAWHEDDLRACARLFGLRGVVVPKAESPSDIDRALALLRVPVAPLVETALGVERVADVLAIPGVERVLVGNVDLAVDLDCDEESDVLDLARGRVVLASRAAGKAAPVDGVTTRLRDPAVAEADARRARRDGFSGKLAVHPRQVSAIRAGFRPSPEELAWARQVLASATDTGQGAVSAGGALVDAPVVRRARRLLAVGAESLTREGRD